MRFTTLFAAAAMVLSAVSTAAGATPVAYTLSGTFNGSVGATTITGGTFTWTTTGDTSKIMSLGGALTNAAITDTIDIGGFGTLTPTEMSAFIALPAGGVVGFFFAESVDNGTAAASLRLLGYDGRTSIGPLPVVFLGNTPVPTDMGDFAISSASRVIFQASVVPEPITPALFGAGLAGIGVMRRRKA